MKCGVLWTRELHSPLQRWACSDRVRGTMHGALGSLSLLSRGWNRMTSDVGSMLTLMNRVASWWCVKFYPWSHFCWQLNFLGRHSKLCPTLPQTTIRVSSFDIPPYFEIDLWWESQNGSYLLEESKESNWQEKGTEKLSKGMEMFCILFWVVVTQMNTYIKIYQAVHLKSLYF